MAQAARTHPSSTQAAKTSRRLVTRRVKLSELHADPSNARRHDARNLAAISDSLNTFGQVEPLVVQKSTGRVIGGNGRLEVLRQSGATECDIVEVDVNDTQAAAMAIALNRTAELGSWDDEALTKLLESLPTDLVQVAGFTDDELQQLISEFNPPEVNEDEVPAPPDHAATRRGDRWTLGNHVLLCGDSADALDVDRLLAGAPIHVANCDCPYNVKVEPRSNNAFVAGKTTFHPVPEASPRAGKRVKATTAKLRAKDRPLENDCVSDEAFAALLDGWFGNIARVLLPGRAFYIWGGYANLNNYPPVLERHGLYFSQCIVWDKQHPVLTRKDFMGAFEIAFYGWREGAGHVFLGPNNIPDIWAVKKVSPQAMIHLTEKPVELAARAIQYSSRQGENILDLFGGSGSTLMAAEQTGRRAFLMELDPLYCDVILMRYAGATGRQPTLDCDGRTFEQVKAERLATEKTPEPSGVEGAA